MEENLISSFFLYKIKVYMFKNKFNTAAFVLLSLATSACSDTVEHYIASVSAPEFVSVSPQTNIKAGLDSIIVSYDKNVFFASEDYAKWLSCC